MNYEVTAKYQDVTASTHQEASSEQEAIRLASNRLVLPFKTKYKLASLDKVAVSASIIEEPPVDEVIESLEEQKAEIEERLKELKTLRAKEAAIAKE